LIYDIERFMSCYQRASSPAEVKNAAPMASSAAGA